VKLVAVGTPEECARFSRDVRAMYGQRVKRQSPQKPSGNPADAARGLVVVRLNIAPEEPGKPGGGDTS
jgi:hypothetical protein